MSKFASFAEGFNMGQRMVKDYRAEEDRQKLQEIGDATVETVPARETSTGEANAQQAIYGGDGAGAAQAMAAAGVSPARFKFLGQTTDAAPTDTQMQNARSRAMAGVMMKNDPAGATRMLQGVTQSERDDSRFDWEKSRAEREMRDAKIAEDHAAVLRDTDAKTADWFKARVKNPDGTDRAATIDDHLAASLYRGNMLTQAGKINEAGQVLKDHSAQSMIKIQLETTQRDQALGQAAAAAAAGDLSGVKDFYNKFVPDGARVTDVQKDPNTGAIVIKRETVDGRPMADTRLKDTSQVLATLATFKDPMALHNWSQSEFTNNLATKADARSDATSVREEKRLNIEAGSAGVRNKLATAQIAELEQKTTDRADLSNIHDTLSAAIESGDKAAETKARSKLMTYTTGSKGSQMSDTERKANFFLASGAARTPMEAATMAHQKVQPSVVDRYFELSKPTNGIMPSARAVSAVMTDSFGPDWKSQMRGGADKTIKVPENIKPQDITDTAKKHGISEAEVRKRLGIPG